MKVFITGGAGFVGRALTAKLASMGHEVFILSRSASKKPDPGSGIVYVSGDPAKPGPWQEQAGSADVVVNLVGETIFQRWTDKARKRIYDSRILSTRNIVRALAEAGGQGRILLSASAVGYYGSGRDEVFSEDKDPGKGFLAEVTKDWEGEARQAESSGVRVCLMRFGVVLDSGGGALGKMIPLFKYGLGGKLGRGNQWFSWIHRSDLVNAVAFLIERDDAAGPFNFTSPNPVRNSELTKALAGFLKRPAVLPAPGFMVKTVLGEFSSVLLEGQRVAPTRLLEMNFDFKYPLIDSALEDILERN